MIYVCTRRQPFRARQELNSLSMEEAVTSIVARATAAKRRSKDRGATVLEGSNLILNGMFLNFFGVFFGIVCYVLTGDNLTW